MVQDGSSPEAEARHHEIIESFDKQDGKLSEMVAEMRALSGHIVQVLTNKVPEGYLPLDVHRQAMTQLSELHQKAMEQLSDTHKDNTKSLNRSWTWVLLAALAIVKLAPVAEQAVLGKLPENPPVVASHENPGALPR